MMPHDDLQNILMNSLACHMLISVCTWQLFICPR